MTRTIERAAAELSYRTPLAPNQAIDAAKALADAQPPILMPDFPEPDGTGTYVGTWFRADGTAWLPEHVEDNVASVIDTNTPGYITVRVEGDVLLSIAQDHALDFARKIIAAHNQGADRG